MLLHTDYKHVPKNYRTWKVLHAKFNHLPNVSPVNVKDNSDVIISLWCMLGATYFNSLRVKLISAPFGMPK
jgi:hypothetical protein